MERSSHVRGLAEHPHREEVFALLAALPRLAPDDLIRLGAVLVESPPVVAGRARCRAGSGPWGGDLNRLLGVLHTLYQTECAALGEPAERGLEALADALRAAYAAPVLPVAERLALRQPWAQVMEGAPPLALVSDGPDATAAVPVPRKAVDLRALRLIP